MPWKYGCEKDEFPARFSGYFIGTPEFAKYYEAHKDHWSKVEQIGFGFEGHPGSYSQCTCRRDGAVFKGTISIRAASLPSYDPTGNPSEDELAEMSQRGSTAQEDR